MARKLIFEVGVETDHEKFKDVSSVKELYDTEEFSHLSESQRRDAEEELFSFISNKESESISDVLEQKASEEG